MEIVELELGERSYNIYIGSGIIADRSLVGAGVGRDAFVVTNETIGPLFLPSLKQALGDRRVETIALPDGEQFKTLATFETILNRMLETGQKRSTTLFALGGGVVGDVAGFAAASFQRGVDFVQVPTTLLSQVDSSVGGKTAVNHRLGKNMIGAFHQPKAVLIDTRTLTSLPPRELAAGLAEIIKHGALADPEYLDDIEASMPALLARDADTLARIIRRSCEIKADVVSQDEREGGVRALLNFGHTFAHGIEAGLGYGEWLHGEAVGAGMVMAADLSWRLGLISREQGERLRRIVASAGLPVAPPASLAERMLALMARDKKATDDGLVFIVLDRLGEARIESNVPVAALAETLAAGDRLLAG